MNYPSRLQSLLFITISSLALPVIGGMNEAAKAFSEDNFKVALEEYLPLAKQGDPEAQTKSGYILLLGKGVKTNVKEGMQWLAKAEQQGSTQSAYILGLAYLHQLAQKQVAREVPLNAKLGVELLSKAAKNADVRKLAAKELRRVYATGLGNIPKDNDKVIYWWEFENDLLTTKVEAEKGDAQAAEKLGLAYLDFEPVDGSVFKGSPVIAFRNRTAEKWLSLAARDGKISSQAAKAYGCLYLDQPGVASDVGKAKKWVEISHDVPRLMSMAAAGDAEAMVKIGDTYYDSCLRENYREDAFPWYRKAVAAGNIKRAWRLMAYADNFDEKRHWAEIAAAIINPDGSLRQSQYGGEAFFDNLDYGSDIPWGFRHAPGTRYLSLKPVQIYLKPDKGSPIVHDIGSLRLIYARESKKDGWLAVIATSRRRYPDTYSYITNIDDESVDNFLNQNTSYRPNRQYVYGLIGYVPKSNLASLDEALSLPLQEHGLIPVPSLWENIGIKEDRKFITDFSSQPYDAIVRVKTAKGSCSGAFVLNPSLVITAGHCASKKTELVEVIIERSTSHREAIPAQWLAYTYNDKEDWAVLKLKYNPQSPVKPLEFADGMSLSSLSQLKISTIGYPGDLFKLSENLLGFIAPSIKTCTLDLNRHWYFKKERNIVFEHYCHTWYGDSGGPLLVWNSENSRFEVLGVNAWVNDGFQNKYKDKLLGTQKFKTMMYEKYHEIEVPLLKNGQPLLKKEAYFEEEREAYKATPGISAVMKSFREQVESLYSENAMLSLKMIEVTRKAAGRSPDASPFSDAPDKLGFWMHGFDETYDFVRSTDEARIACINECDKPILQKNDWTLKYGERIDLKKLAKREDTMVIYKLNAIVVGGDLFHVDENNLVDGVSRQFMNLMESGKGFNQYYKHTYQADSDSINKDDFPSTHVASTSSLHDGPIFGGETPMSIPGGMVIGTAELYAKHGSQHPPIIISSIGGSTGIPGAIDLSYSSAGGNYMDVTQQRFEKDLNKLTNGNKRAELVFYCHHNQCWMSYNSALRAIRLGYQNVYWYRGGIKSWIKSGAPLDWVSKAE
ncbi:trypsin-like serine protease [Azotobacter chroococcum]|uniref:trypsin-like serine protease n=1 Tax=Azotobacter chroococcum TaxID=353 RepID=UPI0010AE5CDB|nr:trypsin-like serine protease [Azotobacter chroococcum]TKD47212.1 trypsin-like serine protease [Azotobacter chroococcum]